jgi:uncharacterized protein YukE
MASDFDLNTFFGKGDGGGGNVRPGETDSAMKENSLALQAERSKIISDPNFLSPSWKGSHQSEWALMCNRIKELTAAIKTPRDQLDPLGKGMADSRARYGAEQAQRHDQAERVMDVLEGLDFQREKIPNDIRDFELSGLAAQALMARGEFEKLELPLRLGINRCPQTQTGDIEALFSQYRTEEDPALKKVFGEKLIFQIVSLLQRKAGLKRNCVPENPKKKGAATWKGGAK